MSIAAGSVQYKFLLSTAMLTAGFDPETKDTTCVDVPPATGTFAIWDVSTQYTVDPSKSNRNVASGKPVLVNVVKVPPLVGTLRIFPVVGSAM